MATPMASQGFTHPPFSCCLSVADLGGALFSVCWLHRREAYFAKETMDDRSGAFSISHTALGEPKGSYRIHVSESGPASQLMRLGRGTRNPGSATVEGAGWDREAIARMRHRSDEGQRNDERGDFISVTLFSSRTSCWKVTSGSGKLSLIVGG